MRTKEYLGIGFALIASSALAVAVIIWQIPRPPEPALPPIVETEEVAIVEAHRTLEHAKPAPPQTADAYLCEVYGRTPVKRDGAGDFTWKDKAAAARLGMDTCTYAIGGMAPELKTRLVAFGRAADAQGLQWSIFSAFRDDYRQGIASGLKARTGNSLHGNSRATRGYGHGRAIDIAAVGPIAPILALMDSIGRGLGLTRPYKGFDPNHVQLAAPSTRVAAKTDRHFVKTKTKVRLAKRIKHRTRIAARTHDPDSYRRHNDRSHRARYRSKVPVSRRA